MDARPKVKETRYKRRRYGHSVNKGGKDNWSVWLYSVNTQLRVNFVVEDTLWYGCKGKEVPIKKTFRINTTSYHYKYFLIKSMGIIPNCS